MAEEPLAEETVGRFCLADEAGFNVRLQFVYWDQQGKRHHVQGTDSYPLGQEKCRSPGESNVPNGSRVSLYASVVLGWDRTAQQIFIYEEGSPMTAKYAISGTIFNAKLGLIGVEPTGDDEMAAPPTAP